MSDKRTISDDEQQKQIEAMAQVKLMNEEKPQKKHFAKVVTLGCQQNKNDSERIMGMLNEMGYEFTEDTHVADLIIFNTCAIRENAEKKVFGNIGALKHLKLKNPNLLIGVCGCMPQQEHIATRLKAKYRHVSMIFGTHSLYRFPSILKQAIEHNKTVLDIYNTEGNIAEGIPIHRNDTTKAWVSIMYGCNNYCSYCIVPYVRGRERSREAKDIIDEITALKDQGCKEITLLGQNVNSYGNDIQGMDFADLLKKVSEIEGLERIRFMTSHPKDITDKLIDTMAACSNVCKQLHLPFQAGSNKVLKLMNRRYTREKYLDIIKKVKEKMPDISLTTDVIVGFPGETNEDFDETISLIKEVQFDGLYSFIFSKRKGTPAYDMNDVLTDDEKQANFDKLLLVQNEISNNINKKLIGKTVKVLVESESRKNKDKLTGRNQGNKAVNFDGDLSLVGKIVDVKILEAHTWSLNGELI